jgi:hypothetical protein
MFNCGCEVDYISIDFNSKVGTAYFSEMRYPDMGKTIRAFLAIDDEIKAIDTYVDGKVDTRYLYIPAVNEWQAFPPFKSVFGEVS